jgi:hypothetical protein
VSGSVLLIASNGVGMGHLARQTAVALALKGRTRCVVLALSRGASFLGELGIPVEYCLSYNQPWATPWQWDTYFQGRVEALAKEIEAGTISFDGVAPYRGLIRAVRGLGSPRLVWQRRVMLKGGLRQRDVSGFFHAILEPSDIAGDEQADESRIRIPPVSLTSVIRSVSRAEAVADLGLDPERPTLLLNLGLGVIGNMHYAMEATLSAMHDRPEWQVCITRPLGRDGSEPRNAIVLDRVFPLVRYTQAFDAAVSAAGYNAVHELIPSLVPTLLVPNTATGSDDQAARAAKLAARGLALTASSPSAVESGVRHLLDETTRSDLVAAVERADLRVDGAQIAAQHLEAWARSGPTKPKQPFAPRYRSEDAFIRAFGGVGEQAVRKMKPRPKGSMAQGGKPLSPSAGRPTPGNIIFTENVEDVRLNPDSPIEHILGGTSAAYRVLRSRTAETFYGRT